MTAPGGARSRPRDLPASLLLICAGVAASAFNGHSHDIGLPISPDRPLIGGGLLLLVLDPRAWKERPVRWRWIHGALALMIVYATLSAAAVGTLTTSTGFYALLDRLGVVPFVLFLAAPVLFRTPGRRDVLLRTMALVGLYLGLTAFFEQQGPHSLVWPRYIMDPSVGIHFGRARGPFTEAVADGLAMTQCGLAAAWGAIRFRRGWRWVCTASALVCGLGVMLTLTRAVWVGAAVGLLVAVAFLPRIRRFLPVVLLGGLVAVGVALAVVPGLSSGASSRADSQIPLWDRYNTNHAALRIIEAKPLTGVGWLEFINVEADWQRQAADYPVSGTHIEVHDVLLSRAAELGLPGAALWVVCVLGGPGQALVRRADGDLVGWRAVFAGGLTGWVVAAAFGPLPYPQANLLVWMSAGIVLSPYLTRAPSSAPDRPVGPGPERPADPLPAARADLMSPV